MKQYLHIVFLFLSAVLTTTTLAGCGADKNLKKGEKYLAIGEYYDAANQFRQAYSKTAPKEKARRGDIALKIAHCNERINATQKAPMPTPYAMAGPLLPTDLPMRASCLRLAPTNRQLNSLV